MSPINENPLSQYVSPLGTNALNAFGPYLGTVITAQRYEFCMSRSTAALAVLVKIASASQGAAYILDETQRKIPLALNGVMLAPTATYSQFAQRLFRFHAEIEGEVASLHTEKAAAYQLARLSHKVQRQTLKAELKLATAGAAQFELLRIQLASHKATEPQSQDFLEVEEKNAALQVHIAKLEQSRSQAKADGDLELAKTYSKQLKVALGEDVLDSATAHARWQSRYDLRVDEVARLEGVFGLDHLVDINSNHFFSEPYPQ